MKRPSLVNQILGSLILLCGIALYEQYNVGLHANTVPNDFVITEVGSPINVAADITPAAITKLVELPAPDQATVKNAVNRKSIETGDQQCRLNADGTSSCASRGGSCGQSASGGPARRFFRNGGVFRRGLFRGRFGGGCRGGC